MKPFEPFVIEHIQLNELENHKFTGKRYLLFIWCNQIPLGHVWLEVKPACVSELKAAVTKALWQTFHCYLGEADNNNNWQIYLNNGNYAELSKLFTDVLKESERPASLREEATLSVVICTRNRPVAIKECIKSLMESTDKNFELVVIDNAPNDDSTKLAVAEFANVRYVREERKGLDIARNTGARNATGDLIAYTDDDVLVDKNWIKTLKTCFDDPLTMAVTGQVFPVEIKTKSQYIFEKYWGFNKGYCQKTFDHKYFLDHLDYGVPVWDIGAGANMAFRREIFDLVGWFDERLDVGASGCSGDSEFWYKILAEGWNCSYFPNLFVHHQHRTSKKELDKQLFSYMRGQVSSLLVQHEKYGHEGNLVRVKKALPKYYAGKLRNLYSFFAGTALTEIRGCVSGYKFYQRHKEKKEEPYFVLPAQLTRDVTVDESTLVSVIIPCYNQGHYLKHAIESALSQTWTCVEIVVVDDGSNDDTALVAAEYNVKYVRVERVGVSAARNIGVQFSSGSFVVFLDADNLLYPNAVELNLNYFSIYKNTAFVSGGHARIDENGNWLPGIETVQKLVDNYAGLLLGNYIGMEATVLYRRELFFAFHWDATLKGCEDYDLNLKITRYLPVFSHSTIIAAYRIHKTNTSHNVAMMYESAKKVLERQRRFLRTKEEAEALEAGLQNWQQYYFSNLNSISAVTGVQPVAIKNEV